MNLKKMGIADKIIFILGLILGSIIAVILVLGVIVAALQIYAEGKKRFVQIRSVPVLDHESQEALASAPFEQGPVVEPTSRRNEALTGNEDETAAIERYILLLEEDLRQPGQLDAETYSVIIGKLGEAYRQADRHQEAEACSRRLNKKRAANER